MFLNKDVTARERQTIIEALRIAAEVYLADAHAATEMKQSWIALAFNNQRLDALALADKLES